MTTAPYCDDCGKPMKLRSAKGLHRELIPGVRFAIPESIRVWRCSTCGDYAIDPETGEAIDRALAGEVREWKARQAYEMIERLRATHGASQNVIAAVLDVTAAHLSHCINGTKEVSLTLVRLMQALVAAPAEFERHRARRPTLDVEQSLWGAPAGHRTNSSLSMTTVEAQVPVRSTLVQPANDSGYLRAATGA